MRKKEYYVSDEAIRNSEFNGYIKEGKYTREEVKKIIDKMIEETPWKEFYYIDDIINERLTAAEVYFSRNHSDAEQYIEEEITAAVIEWLQENFEEIAEVNLEIE